jgi:hypothetical protein
MPNRITSKNLPPVGEHLKINLWDIEDSILQDLRDMSRESFWKNELHNEEHPDFAHKYSTEVPEHIIMYIVDRLEQYWKILRPEEYQEQ